MDHVVYVDTKAKELDKLLDSCKSMIIRGAAGRKMPHGRVNPGDVLYFLNNDAHGLAQARATVKRVFHSGELTPFESEQLVQENQVYLQLTENQVKRWAGKRFLVLVGIGAVERIPPFAIDKSGYGNMDDWLPVGDIATVRHIPDRMAA